jgi:hypothetical protein
VAGTSAGRIPLTNATETLFHYLSYQTQPNTRFIPPQDLDLHCLTSNCHVFHESSNCPDGSVVLEKDVRHGFGPETILLNLPFKGTCHFFVHLYDGVGCLGGCGATLRLFGSNGPICTFDVPAAPAEGADKAKYW